MKNELLTIGPVTIHGYGLMIGIGVIAAYLTAEYRARKLKLDADQVFSLVIWCLVFGGLGSKLLFCLAQLDTILADPSLPAAATDARRTAPWGLPLPIPLMRRMVFP